MRYIDAVRAQGQNLRASRAALSGQLAGLDLAPWREARLGLVGMGASYNAVLAAVGCYWAAGLRAAVWPAPTWSGPAPRPTWTRPW